MSRRDNFEQEWVNAFEGAEEKPSEHLWSELKAELATMDAEKQRSMVVFWRWVGIAASVSLLVLAGFSGYHLFTESNSYQEQISLNKGNITANEVVPSQKPLSKEEKDGGVVELDRLSETSTNQSAGIIETASAAQEPNMMASERAEGEKERNEKVVFDKLDQEKMDSKVSSLQKSSADLPTAKPSNSENSFLAQDVTDSSNEGQNKLYQTNNDVASIIDGNTLNPIQDVEPLAQLKNDIYMQKVPDLTKLYSLQKKNDFHSMWAGLSMSGGSFNPNVGQPGGMLFGSNAEADFVSLDGLNTSSQEERLSAYKADAVNKVEESPAFAYSIGFDFGRRVAKRLIIESGIEYAKYSSEATSNLAAVENKESQAFIRNYGADNISYSDVQFTSTYSLENTFEYVSIPISLGYVVLDKKMGIVLNSGLGTDIFLNNKLEDVSGEHASVVYENAENSPYRPMALNALFGTEIYYAWSENYIIGIDPSYRMSLTGITKSDANFSSRPSTFFIGLKFRYIL